MGNRESVQDTHMTMFARFPFLKSPFPIAAQCRKCRTPVNTIAMSYSSAAAMKAAEAALEVRGCGMASDAFFPFRDGIDAAAEAGIRAVIQPGGSMRDNEVIAAADEYDMAMVFTGVRHFRH